MDSQAESNAMALESMRMLNREQGMDEEEALALEQELYGGMVPGPDVSSENGVSQDVGAEFNVQQDPVADMTLDTMSDQNPVQDTLPTDPAEQQNPGYSNFFARLVNGVAQMVGPETELGMKLNDLANELEGKDATSEQFKDSVNEYGYHDFNELSEDNLADKPEGTMAGKSQDGLSGNPDVDPNADPDTVPFVPKGTDPKADRQNAVPGDVESGTGIKADTPYPLDKNDPESESKLRTDITDKNDKIMSDFARQNVLSESFLKAGADDPDMSCMSNMIGSMRQELDQDTFDQMVGIDAYDDGSPQKQHCADTHMGMMRGLKAYNDTAKECIEKTYADDPAKKEQAMNGLKRTMQELVPTAYDTCYDNDKRYDFLSESDKKELDSMEFTGVDVKYSDYTQHMDAKAMQERLAMSMESGSVQPGSSGEQDLYANAGLDDQIEKSEDTPDKSEDKALDKGAGKSEKSHRDRGAQAESLFGDQLKKFAQQENSVGLSL